MPQGQGGAFADQVALQLRQDGQHAEHHLAGGAGGVDALGETNEVGPGLVEPLADGEGVPGRPGQAGQETDSGPSTRPFVRLR